jgi:hypothetical protein
MSKYYVVHEPGDRDATIFKTAFGYVGATDYKEEDEFFIRHFATGWSNDMIKLAQELNGVDHDK